MLPNLCTAKFGMTPEKLAEGREIISRDASEERSSLEPNPEKKTTLSKNTAVASFNAVPESSRSPPQLGFTKLNTAQLPLKPFSQSPIKNASVLSEPTVINAFDNVDYKSVLTKFYQAMAPASVAEVDSILQKYRVREVCG